MVRYDLHTDTQTLNAFKIIARATFLAVEWQLEIRLIRKKRRKFDHAFKPNSFDGAKKPITFNVQTFFFVETKTRSDKAKKTKPPIA